VSGRTPKAYTSPRKLSRLQNLHGVTDLAPSQSNRTLLVRLPQALGCWLSIFDLNARARRRSCRRGGYNPIQFCGMGVSRPVAFAIASAGFLNAARPGGSIASEGRFLDRVRQGDFYRPSRFSPIGE